MTARERAEKLAREIESYYLNPGLGNYAYEIEKVILEAEAEASKQSFSEGIEKVRQMNSNVAQKIAKETDNEVAVYGNLLLEKEIRVLKKKNNL